MRETDKDGEVRVSAPKGVCAAALCAPMPRTFGFAAAMTPLLLRSERSAAREAVAGKESIC
eukprot:6187774-Pleurochrysis_carterae.AAC.1